MLSRFLFCAILLVAVPYTMHAQQRNNKEKRKLEESVDFGRALDSIRQLKCNDFKKNSGFPWAMEKQLQQKSNAELLSRYYVEAGNYYWGCIIKDDSALKYFHAALLHANKSLDYVRINAAQMCLFRFYRQANRIDSAYYYLNNMLQLTTDVELLQISLGEAGLFSHDLGDYKNSLMYYDSLLNLLNRRGASGQLKPSDSLTYITTQLNVSDIYLSIREYGKALKNYKQCLQLGQDMNNDLARFYGQYGLGKTYLAMDSYEPAKLNLNAALNLGQNSKLFKASAEVANLLAECNLKQGDIEKAISYNALSRSLANRKQYKKQLAICAITDGKIELHRKHYAAATDSILSGLQGAIDGHDLEVQKSAYQLLSEAYTALNQPAQALDAYRNFISLKDSLYDIEKANQLLRMDLEASFGRRQLLDSVAHEHKATAIRLQLQRQTVITYSSFIGILLVCVLLFFIYRNYNTQKKYNELLNREKVGHLAHIEEQSNVLSDIAFTQAHDIRGPVSTLLGLTQILNTENPADPENKEILEGIVSVTERLDKTVKDVISKENSVNQKEKQLKKG